MNYVALGLLILIFLTILSFIIFAAKPKTKITQFRGKYCPMSGKCYLYRHDVTGVIIRSRNMDKAVLFETETEATIFIDEFKNQKK